MWPRRSKPDDAYTSANLRTRALWLTLDKNQHPSARRAVYDTLAGTYALMARELTPGHVPAGYDGDCTRDLWDVASLCHVLGTSESALACDPGDRPGVPLGYIPGAPGDARLAAAWELFWVTSDRAQRAALIRGHHSKPARRVGHRQPGGIIPLTSLYAGSAVTGFLEAVADAEELLARPAPADLEAAR